MSSLETLLTFYERFHQYPSRNHSRSGAAATHHPEAFSVLNLVHNIYSVTVDIDS